MSHAGEESLKIQVYEPRGMAIDYSDHSPHRGLFWTDFINGNGAIRKTELVDQVIY